MKNHLFLKNFDEDFYKSGSGKIFQSVHQQNTFLVIKCHLQKTYCGAFFWHMLTSSFFIPDPLTQEQM